MPPVGFEPTISAGERSQTYALDRAATGTGKYRCYDNIKIYLKEIGLDCADKKCSSRKGTVLRFCYCNNELSSFKRKADFVNNIYLSCHISCVGFGLRMLNIVIGLRVLELL